MILIFFKYDGLTYHTSKYDFFIFNNVYRNKKYKTKLKTTLRIASTSSCLVLFKEFGPYIIVVVSLVAKTTWLDQYVIWAIRLAIQSMMDNGFGPKRSTTIFFSCPPIA
jgi:hypothetical protein